MATRTTCSIVLAALLAASCKRGEAANPQGKPGGGGPRGPVQFPVEVTAVEARRVEYAVHAVGSVDAFEIVQVTARVAGAAELIKFAEGDQVKQGQVIIEVDPDRYRLNVDTAKAALERAQALLADSQANLQRREEANKNAPGMFTEEELQTWRTRIRTGEVDIKAAHAALALAELNLRDALVRAPIAGIIQTRTVQTGQYVQPGQVLATLLRKDPLLLRFEVPESDASRFSTGTNAFFTVRDTSRKFAARIMHIAGQANAATRMVPITAKIEDEEKALLRPGAFAQVTVPVGGSDDAAVIPQTAVRPSERGFLGYTVENDKAREHVLALGLRTLDGKVEVRSGLKPGDVLVVRGAEALKDGAAVRVVPTGTMQGKPQEKPVVVPPGPLPSVDGGTRP